MRLAVCGNSQRETEQLCRWLEQVADLYSVQARCTPWRDFHPVVEAPAGTWQAAFIGLGGSKGFLAARTLRQVDKRCAIVLIDDTPQYAVQGVRLHFTDFIVRPVEFRHIVRSLHLIFGRL